MSDELFNIEALSDEVLLFKVFFLVQGLQWISVFTKKVFIFRKQMIVSEPIA